ncbi:MAG TPA: citrate/2-methylcitrate synthase [Nitrososphaerales archaeon]|nr:citrate/2-methylcitrate synthase [Nitrososphaerales archaeon]
MAQRKHEAEATLSKNPQQKVVKVSDETHAELVSMAKWNEPLDHVIHRLMSQTKGMEDVVIGKSSICFIDGEEGRLLYRGYDIVDLAIHSNYEETAYLLWNGHLPTAAELQSFTAEVNSKREVPGNVLSILTGLPRNCDAMDALRVGVAALGLYDDPMYTQQEKAVSIAAKMGTMVAAIHRHKHDQEVLLPRRDLGYSANLLYMVTGEKPTEQDTKLMDVLLILHADHELNASTFAARVIASTLSDVYSAITGAVGCLKGPLHGGANEKVIEMTIEIGNPENAESYVDAMLAKRQKITGFGHRVYKTMDPRAAILKDMARRFVKSEKEKRVFQILTKTEEMMKTWKNMYPNVDLYSGLALNHVGIPSYLFTPVFAVGRAPGWLAHVLEQYSDNRLIRPRAEYVGPQRATYVPLEQRTQVPVAKA